jgi:hypothetical protein
MTDKELIRNIKKLGEIQPTTKWLNLTRYELISEISPQKQPFGTNGFFNWLLHAQSMALIACLLLIFVGGPWLTVKASQSSLPGELLYSVKKIDEGFKNRITSDQNRAYLQAEFATKRLEELDKITENFLSLEEKSNKSKQVLGDFRNNLAGINQYVNAISKKEAVAVAKKTKEIKDELDKTKQEVSEETKINLIEAEKAIAEIDCKILSILTGDREENIEESATSTDKETLIWLEEGGTTTEEIIE